MSTEHVRQAAVHVHSIARGEVPKDAVSKGFHEASKVLAATGDFSFGNGADQRSSTDRFVQAVSEVIRHRDITSPYDFSEGPVDIARMTLAAWSFDRLVDDRAGRDVPDDHARFVHAVAPVVSPHDDLIGVVDDDTLLDRHVSDLSRLSVLSAASLPYAGEASERPAWEGDIVASHGGDELLGCEWIAYRFPAGSRGEVEDYVMDTMIEAVNASQDLRHSTHSVSPEALRSASAARMPVPGDLDPGQQGLLAVEAYMQARLSRPLRPEEHRMGERALDRIIETGPSSGSAEGVARSILLDVSVQMQAARTIEEGSFGRRAIGYRQAFDDVISASAGLDTHASGLSPARESVEAIAEGRYRDVLDRDIAASILDGLSEARLQSFSKTIDTDLDFQTRVLRNGRARVSSILDEGPQAVTRGLGKGPPSPGSAVMGILVEKGSAER